MFLEVFSKHIFHAPCFTIIWIFEAVLFAIGRKKLPNFDDVIFILISLLFTRPLAVYRDITLFCTERASTVLI